MNKKDKKWYAPLKHCCACGMDAGARRVVVSKVPEEYFVECQICGFKTKRHTTLNAATREWNRE